MDSVTKLEFPDWSGMKPRHFPVSFAEAVAFNEEMNRLFPAPAEAHRLRLANLDDLREIVGQFDAGSIK